MQTKYWRHDEKDDLSHSFSDNEHEKTTGKKRTMKCNGIIRYCLNLRQCLRALYRSAVLQCFWALLFKSVAIFIDVPVFILHAMWLFSIIIVIIASSYSFWVETFMKETFPSKLRFIECHSTNDSSRQLLNLCRAFFLTSIVFQVIAILLINVS